MSRCKHFYVTRKKRIKRGREYLRRCLAAVNKEEKAKVMQEQIDVVGGSRKVYELVDGNLKKGLIECSLWKETFDLYQWRKLYFWENLPSHELWFSNTGEVDTTAYQITKNFDQVVDVCCSDRKVFYDSRWSRRVWPDLAIYLGVSSAELEVENFRKRRRIFNLHQVIIWSTIWSTNASATSMYFELSRTGPPLGQYFHQWQDSYLRYGDLVRILFDKYGDSPRRLEELAMKTVKKDGRIALENLSRSVQENDDFGFFRPETHEDDMEKLSKHGQSLLGRLKVMFQEIAQEKKRK